MACFLRNRQMTRYELDRFGGWTGKRFEATGFFHTEKDKRWWLVTPEGNAFLSFGVNHLHAYWWQQDYNRAAWQKRLGVDDLYSQVFTPALKAWFLQTCRQYGFNTVGVHTDLPIVNQPQPSMPYMQPIDFIDIPHWKTEVSDSNFKDVFSGEFTAHCDQLAKDVAAPARDDPFLLGYAMTDCPLLTEEDCRERPDVIGGAVREARIGWPRRLRNLPANAPGKQAHVQTVHGLYRGQISDFNATYSTYFDSFAALETARNWRPQTDLSNGNETVTMSNSSKKLSQNIIKQRGMRFIVTIRIICSSVTSSTATPIHWTLCCRLQASSRMSSCIRCMGNTRCRSQDWIVGPRSPTSRSSMAMLHLP